MKIFLPRAKERSPSGITVAVVVVIVVVYSSHTNNPLLSLSSSSCSTTAFLLFMHFMLLMVFDSNVPCSTRSVIPKERKREKEVFGERRIEIFLCPPSGNEAKRGQTVPLILQGGVSGSCVCDVM